MSTHDKMIIFRLPAEVKAELERLAKEDNRTLTGYLRDLILKSLEKNKEVQ